MMTLTEFVCVERGCRKIGCSFFTRESPQHPLPSHPRKVTADGGKAEGNPCRPPVFFDAVLHAAATRD